MRQLLCDIGFFTGRRFYIGDLFFRLIAEFRGLVGPDIFFAFQVGIGDFGFARGCFDFFFNYNFGNVGFCQVLNVRNQLIAGDDTCFCSQRKFGRIGRSHRGFIIVDDDFSAVGKINNHLAVFDVRALCFGKIKIEKVFFALFQRVFGLFVIAWNADADYIFCTF